MVEGAAEDLAFVGAAEGAFVVAEPAGVAGVVGEEALGRAALAGEEDDLVEIHRGVLQEDGLLELAIVGIKGAEILLAGLDALLQGVDAGGDVLGVGVAVGVFLGVALQAVAQGVEVDGLGEGGQAGALLQLRDGLERLAGAGALAGFGHEDVLALGAGAVGFPHDFAPGVGDGDAEAVESAAEALGAVPHRDALDLPQGDVLAQVKLPHGEGGVLLGVGDGAAVPIAGGVAVDGAPGLAVVGGGALDGGALAGDVLAVLGDDLDLGQRKRGAILRQVDDDITGIRGVDALRRERGRQRSQDKSRTLHVPDSLKVFTFRIPFQATFCKPGAA